MLTVIINNNIYYYSTLIIENPADFENFFKKNFFVITFLLHIGDSRKVKIIASNFHCLRLQHGVLFH